MATLESVELAFGVGFLVLIGGPAIYYFAYLVPKRQRESIHKEVVARGGKVLFIKPAFFVGLLAERNTRRWWVKFTDASGRTVRAKVQTSLFTGLRWIDGPFAVPR